MGTGPFTALLDSRYVTSHVNIITIIMSYAYERSLVSQRRLLPARFSTLLVGFARVRACLVFERFSFLGSGI